MGINKSKNSEVEQSIYIATVRIDQILDEGYCKDLPQELKDKLMAVKEEFKNYKVEKQTSQYKSINGKVLNKDEIKELIVDATGYTKWKLDETETLEKEEIVELQDEFNVTFSEKKIYRYRYFRNTNSRNDVNMITVTALPGYNQVDIDTDRAGISLEGLVTPKEMKKQIEAEMG